MGVYMVTHEKTGCRGRWKKCVKRKVRMRDRNRVGIKSTGTKRGWNGKGKGK